MGNILDYLDWRGDISFASDGFGEVDGLVLSQFVYVPLDKIVPCGTDMTISISEAYSLYDKETVDEKKKIISFEQDSLLFEKLANSKRFGNIMLSGYVNYIDPEKDVQFSAVTCQIEDGTVFVAFSGTDDTVAGWKEDFNISYMQYTLSQVYSVNYLNEKFRGTSKALRIGGHSKGGNLAVYSSAFCEDSVRNAISEVYSFDGPGFREEITRSEKYIGILPKIKSYVPESSVVGMLLSNSMEHKIVKSTASGLKQHFAYNWELIGNRFILADELSKSGTIIKKAVTGWLEEFSDEDRKTLVDTLFTVLEAPEKDTLKEIVKGKWSAYSSMFRAIRGLSPEQQSVIRDAVKKIAKNGRDAIAEEGRLFLKENENGT